MSERKKKIIYAMFGMMFILFGSLMLLGTCLAKDGEWWRIFVQVGVGCCFLYAGSYLLGGLIKKSQNPSEEVVTGGRSLLTYIVYLVILIQCSIFIFQFHELARFDEEIAGQIPSVSWGEYDEVENLHAFRIVKAPFVAQLVLLPTVCIFLFKINEQALKFRRVFLASFIITAFSWNASLFGICFLVGEGL